MLEKITYCIEEIMLIVSDVYWEKFNKKLYKTIHTIEIDNDNITVREVLNVLDAVSYKFCRDIENALYGYDYNSGIVGKTVQGFFYYRYNNMMFKTLTKLINDFKTNVENCLLEYVSKKFSTKLEISSTIEDEGKLIISKYYVNGAYIFSTHTSLRKNIRLSNKEIYFFNHNYKFIFLKNMKLKIQVNKVNEVYYIINESRENSRGRPPLIGIPMVISNYE